MIGSMNRVILAGYVGKDPEIRRAQSGKEVASFHWRPKNALTGKIALNSIG